MGKSADRAHSLNACYVDCDCGRKPDDPNLNPGGALSPWQVHATVMEMVEGQTLPPFSMFVRSGRGCWFLWLLRDVRNPEYGVCATDQNRGRYQEINRALSKRLAHLAADTGATDVSRLIRVPGSVNGKTGLPVIYSVNLDVMGHCPTYRLEDMERALGLGQRGLKTAGNARSAREPSPYRQRAIKGNRGLQTKRVHDIEAVAAHHKVRRGSRRKVLLVYAQALRLLDHSRADTLKKANDLAENCEPAYPSEANDTTVEQVVHDAFKQSRSELRHECKVRNETLINWLRITDDLAETLELQTLLPETLREKRKNAPKKADKRRSLAQQHLSASELAKLTTSALAAFYRRHGLPPVNIRTVQRDLQHLKGDLS